MWSGRVSRLLRVRSLLGSLDCISNHRIDVVTFVHPSTRLVPASSSSLRGWSLRSAQWWGCRFRSSTPRARRESKKGLEEEATNVLDNGVLVESSMGVDKLCRNAETTLRSSFPTGVEASPLTDSGDLLHHVHEEDGAKMHGEDPNGEGYANARSHPNETPGQNSNKSAAKLRRRAKSRSLNRTTSTSLGIRHRTQDEVDYSLENDETELEDGLSGELTDYMNAEEVLLKVESHDPFAIKPSKDPHDPEDADGNGNLDEDPMTKQVADKEAWAFGRPPRGLRDDDDDDDGEGEGEEGRVGSGLGRNPPVPSALVGPGESFASKSLQEAFPDYAAEYVAAASDGLPVTALTVEDAAVLPWRCARCGGVWRCAVFVRCVLRTGCPTCATRHRPTLARAHPELLPSWDPTRNDPFVDPETVDCGSAVMAHWVCPSCGQGYPARVRDRVRGRAGCPSCALAHVQSAAVMAREEGVLLQEWHPHKNGDLRLEALQTQDHRTVVWWLCSLCGHDWEASLAARLSPSRRARGKVCPVCQGKGVGLT